MIYDVTYMMHTHRDAPMDLGNCLCNCLLVSLLCSEEIGFRMSHVCVYIYIYIHAYSIYIYIYMCIYIYVYIYMYIYIYIYILVTLLCLSRVSHHEQCVT